MTTPAAPAPNAVTMTEAERAAAIHVTRKPGAAPDWGVIRLKYVTGTMSMAALAKTEKLNLSATQKQAQRGSWAEARRKVSVNVLATTRVDVVRTRGEELRAWNANDLRLAGAFRGMCAHRIRAATEPGGRVLTATELRQLGAAIAEAQRQRRDARSPSPACGRVGGRGSQVPTVPAVSPY